MEIKIPKITGNFYVFLYVVASVYGAVWVQDESNDLRAFFYGYFAIPFAILFFSLSLMIPGIWEKVQSLHRFCLGAILLSFLWGNLLLLNALTGREPITYGRLFKAEHNERTLNVAYKKGGLGIFYRLRW